MSAPLPIRLADPDRDAAACAAIYAPYVSDSVASFEAVPPDVVEMRRRVVASHAWLVAEDGDEIVGYAYGSTHNPRVAYRWSADVTVYIAPSHHGRGIGRALYTELFELLRAQGMWTLCAGITRPNAGSEGLHEAMGFELVGVYKRIGYKQGAWQDVAWWQLDLRPGEGGAPEERDRIIG